MVHETGLLHWMAIDSSGGIGKEGVSVERLCMSGSVLIVLRIMMMIIGLTVYE